MWYSAAQWRLELCFHSLSLVSPYLCRKDHRSKAPFWHRVEGIEKQFERKPIFYPMCTTLVCYIGGESGRRSYICVHGEKRLSFPFSTPGSIPSHSNIVIRNMTAGDSLPAFSLSIFLAQLKNPESINQS